MNTIVSHIEGVKEDLKWEAEEIADRAEAIHMSYHDSTDEHESKFHVTTGDVDSFANMDHPAAFFIELGYVHNRTGKIIPGKHTMTKAAYG